MINAAMIKELREVTGAGMLDCKKALQETNGNMDEAVKAAYENSREGDIVSLSPASASFDMFKNFEERGNLGFAYDPLFIIEEEGKTFGELTTEEKCSRLEAQVNLLKAENELLKKIRFAERGQQKK